MSMSPKERIEHLNKILSVYAYQYYSEAGSDIPDYAYDKLIEELSMLEDAYPKFALKNSQTQKVGAKVSEEREKIKHTTPFLSLTKVHTELQLASWVHNIIKKVKD